MQDSEGFENALVDSGAGLISSDHRLPAFNYLAALEIAKRMAPEASFILVTGTVSEEFAVTAMKARASDYVLKDGLQRLPSAVQQGLRRKQHKRCSTDKLCHYQSFASTQALHTITLHVLFHQNFLTFIAVTETILQTSIESLHTYFNGLIPLNAVEKELVRKKFHYRLFRKRQYILQEGNVCTHFYYVVRGCLRMYKIDEKGNTHILQFATENNWINDLASFHQIKPSALNIDALEDAVVLQISHADLISLYIAAPKFDRIFRVLIENGFMRLQDRLLQNISSTAEERYQFFLHIYPHLINRLSQVQIAAFIGITPEFLSKLRNKLSKQKP